MSKNARLTRKERSFLNKRTSKSVKLNTKNLSEHNISAIIQREMVLKKEAKRVILNLDDIVSQNKVIASIMFWCEGSKDVSAGLKFTNSDLLMIKKFLYLLRNKFNIDETKFRAVIHIHEYHDASTQTLFWHSGTTIYKNIFKASYRDMKKS